jgi:hypothetical protein
MQYTDMPCVPKLIEVRAGGETFQIKRFGLRKLKFAMAHIAFIVYLVAELEKADLDPVELLMQGGDSAFDLLCLATGKKVEWFDDVDPVEGGELMMAIAETNLDFFVNALKPAALQMKARLATMMKQAEQLRGAKAVEAEAANEAETTT